MLYTTAQMLNFRHRNRSVYFRPSYEEKSVLVSVLNLEFQIKICFVKKRGEKNQNNPIRIIFLHLNMFLSQRSQGIIEMILQG